MTNFLLLLSLVLNVIALFCVVILYLRQNRLLQVEKNQTKLLNEMEEVISTYLLEMTEENEIFIEKVREMTSKTLPKDTHKEASPEKNSADVVLEEEIPQNKINESPPFRKGTVFQAVQAYKNTSSIDKSEIQKEVTHVEIVNSVEVPQNKENANEPKTSELYTQSFYYQALLLKKQGLTTEDIARRLNKGKTEIELLFKLRQNEKE